MNLLMKRTTTILATLTLAASGLYAALDDQKTRISIAQPLEIPGKILTPGDYTLELMGGATNNSAVVIRSSDNETIASLMTIEVSRDEAIGQSEFTFYETPGNQAPALRSWFYPGRSYGHEFIYPESRSKQLAKDSRRYVPSVSDDKYNSSKPSQSSDLEIVAIGPAGESAKVDEGRTYNYGADSKTWRSDEMMRSQRVESRLERQIRKEIVTLPFYSLWDHVEYRVSNTGQVQLMGSVYRPSMKKSVERVVENVEGVSAVTNEIDVLPVSSLDDDLRQALYYNIYGHPALQRYQPRSVPPIHIIVENGNVTLEGVVANEMDKNIAGIQANSVNGVFSVENNLRVGS